MTTDRPARIRAKFTTKRMVDYWGEHIAWHFAPESLKRTFEGLVNTADEVLVGPVEELFGAGEWDAVKRIDFDHFQEGEFQIIFRVTVRRHDKETGVFCLIVAKSPGARSRVAEREFRTLRKVAARVPGVAVQTISSGYARLVEKQRDVSIFIYATHWLEGYHELGVDRKMNFFINEEPFHHYNGPQTDQLKATILGLCLAVYDPKSGEAMAVPLLGAGDCVVTRPARNRPTDVMFIAVRKMLPVESVEACLEMYLAYEGLWGGKPFHLRPDNRGLLEDTVMRVFTEHHRMEEGPVREALARILDRV